MPGTATENWPQYSNGIADASYAFDQVQQTVSLTAGTNARITFPVQANIIRLRNVTVTDVTPALASTAPGHGIAAYVRTDGTIPTAGVGAQGSWSRVVRSGEKVTIARQFAAEAGLTVYNPTAATVTLLIELAA